jgi:adenosylhomocysteine nucleosidase
MDVVVSRQVVYHDVWCGEGNMYGQIQGLPARFEGNATLFDCAMSLDTPTAIHGGLICSGDKFITDRSELNDIKEKLHEQASSTVKPIKGIQLLRLATNHQ